MHNSLLLCFAHPDDESFFAAGTICQYRAAGFDVVLCCGTRGERGTPGNPALCTIEDLAVTREQELRDACSILGVTALEILPYQDQQLSQAPPADIRLSLVRLIRRYRPEVVITFDPNGGNGHPDHIAISRFASDAVVAAADERYMRDTGAPWTVARMAWVCPVAPWQETNRAALGKHPGVDFILNVENWRETKAQALLAHRTQSENIQRLFLQRSNVDMVLGTETFRLGWGLPLKRLPADDLFQDLGTNYFVARRRRVRKLAGG